MAAVWFLVRSRRIYCGWGCTSFRCISELVSSAASPCAGWEELRLPWLGPKEAFLLLKVAIPSSIVNYSCAGLRALLDLAVSIPVAAASR